MIDGIQYSLLGDMVTLYSLFQLYVLLAPVHQVQVVPDELSPGLITGMTQQRCGGYGAGRISS